MKVMNLLQIFTLLILLAGYVVAMDMPTNVQARIESIKQHYQLSPERCRSGALNKDTVFNDETNRMLACLIAGYKYVYLTTVNSFHEMLPGLKVLLPELGIKQFILNDEIILYSPQGARFGLLLAKLQLLTALKAAQFPVEHKNETIVHILPEDELPQENNAYLIGTLLGYPDSDIKYFYVVNDFKTWYENGPRLNAALYPLWPESEKKIFNYYETTEWPKSEGYQEYLADKNITQKWITQHNQQSIAELEQEIKNLQIQLFNLTKANSSRWISR